MPRKDPDARSEYHREYMRCWYSENRELQMRRVLTMNRERRERGKQHVDELKRQPCTEDALPGRDCSPNWTSPNMVCANCHRTRPRLRADLCCVQRSSASEWIARGYVVIRV